MTHAFFGRLGVLFLLCSAACCGQSGSVGRDQIYSVLVGQWTGTLEYRDFQSNERVLLPTWLEAKPGADGKTLEFTYTYDDGPAKTVIEKSLITVDPGGHDFAMTSDRDKTTDSYQIQSSTQSGSRIRMTLKGTGKENDKPVDVRITLTIDRNLYRFAKETREAGQEFAFRDGYTLTRRNP